MLLLRGKALPFRWLKLYSLLLLDVLDDGHVGVGADLRTDAGIVDSDFDAVGARGELLRLVSNLLRRELVGKGMDELNLVGLIAKGNDLLAALERCFLLLQIDKACLLRALRLKRE